MPAVPLPRVGTCEYNLCVGLRRKEVLKNLLILF